MHISYCGITNEILTFALAIYDETLKSFIELVDLVENILFKLMHKKQPKKSYKSRHSCKYGFPYVINKEIMAKLNYFINRWEYFDLDTVIEM
jgi:hypothetical protein